MPRMIRRIAVVAVVLVATSWPVAASAQAQPQGSASDQVVLSGDVTVARGTVVHEVVVFSGSATIAGVVEGDVVVVRGPVTVSGQVGGDVVALHGPIHLLATAQVGGDVRAGGALIAPRARMSVATSSATSGSPCRGRSACSARCLRARR